MVSLAYPLSLLFFFTIFGDSFSSSMANLPSADGENLEKPTSAFFCIYCKQSFATHRSLGGHHRSHNVQLKSAWRRNCPGYSRSSIGVTSTTANPVFHNRPSNSCKGAGNNLAFRNRSSANLTIPVNATFIGSGSTPATGFPSDVSLPLGLNGVGKFSIDEGQTCQDGKPFFCECAMQISQPNLDQRGGRLIKMEGFTSDVGKRIYPVNSLGNTDTVKRSKRPKIVSILHLEIENPQIKELPLVEVMEKEKPFSALHISADAEQKVLGEMDLSLHL